MAGRWSDLSKRNRRLIVAAGTVDGALRLTALADLARRPASQVRGPKWAWALALLVVGSVGVLPVAYFRFGRRSGPS
jgi:hypothetical protein